MNTVCVNFTTKWPSGKSHVFVYSCNFSVNKNILNAFRNCRCQKNKYLLYNLPFSLYDFTYFEIEAFGLLFNLQNSKKDRQEQ